VTAAVAYAENFHGGFVQWHSKQYVKTINILCEGNKVFVKFQAQGGVNPTPLRTPLDRSIYAQQLQRV